MQVITGKTLRTEYKENGLGGKTVGKAKRKRRNSAGK
jgi:hypothetical protein